MSRNHTPNHIGQGVRTLYIILSSALLIYGTIGLVTDDIYIPGKHHPGHHFHGIPCWILYASFLFTVANLISVVVDHYDERNNERNYKRFARITAFLGWALFFAALVVDLFLLNHK